MTKHDLARRLKALEPGCAFPIHECDLAVTFGVTPPLSGAAVRSIRAFAWRRRCVLSYAPCDSGPAFLEKLQPDGDLPGFPDLSCYAGPGRF
jgi:hypothetical protein